MSAYASSETRFYLTSLALMACMLGPIVRSRWAIETSLHWVLDMVFRDDETRVRTDQAPANFCTIKQMAQNLIPLAPGKASLRLKRKAAGWDDDFLASLNYPTKNLHPIPLRTIGRVFMQLCDTID